MFVQSPLSGDVKPPSRLLSLSQGRRNFFFGDVETDVTHIMLVLLRVDAKVVDVEHGRTLRQRDDDILGTVHLQVIKACLLIRNLMQKKTQSALNWFQGYFIAAIIKLQNIRFDI